MLIGLAPLHPKWCPRHFMCLPRLLLLLLCQFCLLQHQASALRCTTDVSPGGHTQQRLRFNDSHGKKGRGVGLFNVASAGFEAPAEDKNRSLNCTCDPPRSVTSHPPPSNVFTFLSPAQFGLTCVPQLCVSYL